MQEEKYVTHKELNETIQPLRADVETLTEQYENMEKILDEVVVEQKATVKGIDNLGNIFERKLDKQNDNMTEFISEFKSKVSVIDYRIDEVEDDFKDRLSNKKEDKNKNGTINMIIMVFLLALGALVQYFTGVDIMSKLVP